MPTRFTITLSIPTSFKEAILKAAQNERRSVASLTEKLLFDYLKENNYLN